MLSRQVELSELQPRLLAWLQKKMPRARDLAVSNLERSGAGISNETFLFNLAWKERRAPKSEGMVLRCAPRSSPVYPDYDLSLQFRVMKALHAAGLPVAKVHWLEQDEKVLGTPFYVMGRVEGVVPPEFPPYHSFGVFFEASPQKRARMWWSAIEAMSRVHQVDWRKLGLSFLGVPKGGTGPLDRQLDYFERYLNWAKDSPEEKQPILEAALNWLRENRYVPARVTLCWGDARMPNTMFSLDGDVVALFDWEMAFLGDPQADLAFFLLLDWVDSEGYGIPRLEGSPGTEETVRRYEELTGWKVDQLHYNEVFAVFRAGIVMMKVLKNFKKLGVALDQADAETNNPCTQRLASLLGLPAPGAPARQTVRVEDVTVTVQFHLTGEGGCDWYAVCEKGRATRHEGTAENPNCTLTVSAADWAAIQRGELDRFNAWTSGKLKIDGDMTLMLQLEETISKLTR
ncbi:MAG: phosphotransferase [Dehalococcoidia bacterium]|nr:phosphotransferase [Dehalococcoidia bacterium]